MTASVVPLGRSRKHQAQRLKEHVAWVIKRVMAERGVTNEQLAEAIGVSGPTISKRLNLQQPMSIDFIEQVVMLLEIEPAEMFEWSPPTGPGLPHLDSNQKPFDLWSPLRMAA